MNKWNWIKKRGKIRMGFCSFNKWISYDYPAWSWLHSSYLYNDSIQFTFLGFNIGYKFKK